MFLWKVMNKIVCLMVTFQKTCMVFFSAGEPRGTGVNLVRPPPVSYHIEIRTPYAEACLGNKGIGAECGTFGS